ncbi:MAG: hypothetical protein WBC53_08605 [Phycisphaerae bacterium]
MAYDEALGRTMRSIFRPLPFTMHGQGDLSPTWDNPHWPVERFGEWPDWIVNIANEVLARGYRLLVPVPLDCAPTALSLIVRQLKGRPEAWYTRDFNSLILGLPEEDLAEDDDAKD